MKNIEFLISTGFFDTFGHLSGKQNFGLGHMAISLHVTNPEKKKRFCSLTNAAYNGGYFSPGLGLAKSISRPGMGTRFSGLTGTGQPEKNGLTARNRPHIFRLNRRSGCPSLFKTHNIKTSLDLKAQYLQTPVTVWILYVNIKE